jgi:hypothetical protein
MAKPQATADLTKPRYTGVITYPDMPFPDIKRGVILVLGTSPNAKVTILSFEGDARRGTQLDVLRKATVEGTKNQIKIHGESARALHELGLKDDFTVDITVDLSKPCPDCGYA